MTDSGSFDPGDLILGADMQALYGLIDSVKTTAGLTPVWDGRTAATYAAGNTITAADVWQLVYNYQHCWDASNNKPGARQDNVAGGAAIAGSLFQNMWTQLGQMTFVTYEYTPDANTYVCAFENTTLNGPETGLGGGLSGSDLVLTAYGDVPGAAGSPLGRALATGRYFLGSAAITNILKSPTWTFIAKGRDCTDTAEGTFARACGSGNDDNFMRLGRSSGGLLSGVVADSSLPWTSAVLPSSGSLYAFMYADGTNFCRLGFSSAKPTSWAAIPSSQKTEHLSSLGNLSGVADATTYFQVNSYLPGNVNAAFQLDWTIEYVVVSRTCLIGA